MNDRGIVHEDVDAAVGRPCPRLPRGDRIDIADIDPVRRGPRGRRRLSLSATFCAPSSSRSATRSPTPPAAATARQYAAPMPPASSGDDRHLLVEAYVVRSRHRERQRPEKSGRASPVNAARPSLKSSLRDESSRANASFARCCVEGHGRAGDHQPLREPERHGRARGEPTDHLVGDCVELGVRNCGVHEPGLGGFGAARARGRGGAARGRASRRRCGAAARRRRCRG